MCKKCGKIGQKRGEILILLTKLKNFAIILSIIIERKIMSFTYNPKKKKRKRTHGFLARISTKSGKEVLRRRRSKGRAKLTV